MENEDQLFEYIDAIRMIGEYLASGNEIITPWNTVISFDEVIALKEGMISLREAELWDTLECTYYNELGSIQRIIELINEFDKEFLRADMPYKVTEEETLEHVSKERKQVYKNIKSRLKKLLNKMVLQLYIGIKVELTDSDIQLIYESGDLNEEYDETSEGYLDHEEEMECDGAEYRQDIEKVERPYLIYSINQKKFHLMQEDEILEEVDVDLAMELVARYLYRTEKKKKIKELQSGKPEKSKIEYRGMHIKIDNELGEK